MKKHLFYCLVVNFIFSTELYVALQMLDQVAIVNSSSMSLVNSIDINVMEISDSCMDYNTEMSCNMADGCGWSMDMCMEISDSCIDYNTEMSCNMADGCEWSMNMCMESGGMIMGSHTPHFIVVDELNNFWFTTTISSGYILRFDLDTNELIDQIFVGDSPALMTINKTDRKLYCSRMMPMGAMMEGSISTSVQEIDYSGEILINSQEFNIPSPAPHGISINSSGSEIFVASNTADWIYKIIVDSGEIFGSVMDSNIDNPELLNTQRLKPIQCLSVSDTLLFVTCSGGLWTDPWTGDQEQINGQVQLWNTNSMELIDTYEYDWNSTPWHIIDSPISNDIYVVLSGDQLYEETAGVSKLSYSDNGMLSQQWYLTDEIFDTLHGIDISVYGDEIYVSGRSDGYLHTINSAEGVLLHSIPLSNNLSAIMAGGVAANYKSYMVLGDINLDNMIDIADIVLLVSYITLNSNLVEVAEYNGDANQDSLVNILDVVSIINFIFNN